MNDLHGNFEENFEEGKTPRFSRVRFSNYQTMSFFNKIFYKKVALKKSY